MQRAAMGNAARRDDRCSVLHFPVHFPRQSRAKRTHFSSCLLLHSDHPTLSSSSALFSAPASPRFLSHQHVLRPSETPTPSTASTFVFMIKSTCLPLPEHLSSTASALVFLCQSTCLPQQAHLSSSTKALATTLPEHLPSPANTIVFHNQDVRLPQPERSASSASTFGFSCQNPRNPQPTESYSQPTGSPASIQAARAAR